jgi:hypothetical protein
MLKVVSFESCLLKAEEGKFSANFARPPSCESPLKFLSASFLIGSLETNWNVGDESSLRKVRSLDRCNSLYIFGKCVRTFKQEAVLERILRKGLTQILRVHSGDISNIFKSVEEAERGSVSRVRESQGLASLLCV